MAAGNLSGFFQNWIRAKTKCIKKGGAVTLLSTYGMVSVSAMLAFYALEDRSHWFIFAFGGACIGAAIYGFLQGAWPFGIIELIWLGVAFHRWHKRKNDGHPTAHAR